MIPALSELESDCEIITFVDADTIPYPNWLRELVNPLKNRQTNYYPAFNPVGMSDRSLASYVNSTGRMARYYLSSQRTLRNRATKIFPLSVS